MKTRPWFVGVLGLLMVGAGACGEGASEDLQDAGNGGGEFTTEGTAADVAAPSDSATGEVAQGEDTAEEAGDGGESAEEVATAPGTEPLLAVECLDSTLAVYTNPAPSMVAAADRGDVFACADDGIFSMGAPELSVDSLGLVASHGVHRARISYRTERAPGTPGVGTASVFFPEPPPQVPTPLVVVAHGTTGLADYCAPSYYPDYFNPMALAFATRGYVVIEPDYAGLGNPGVQGYGDAADTAHSLLDAPQAVSALVAEGTLTGDVVVVGHSQGGGSAVNAQALEKSYGMTGELRAVVNFAGVVATETEVDPLPFQWASWTPANYAFGATGGIGSLLLYSFGANDLDPPDPGVFFHDDHRENIVSWIESLCIGGLIENFATFDPTLMFPDVFAPDFYTGVLNCLQETGPCIAPYDGYIQRLIDNVLPADPEGAPVLIHAGMLDAIVLPASVACTASALAQWGLNPTTCVSPTADHSTVVTQGLAHAVSWVEAMLGDSPPPPCPNPVASLPLCGAF